MRCNQSKKQTKQNRTEQNQSNKVYTAKKSSIIVIAVIMMIMIIVTNIVIIVFFFFKQVRSVYISLEQNIWFPTLLKKKRHKYVNDSKSPALLANIARPLQ